MKQVFLFSEAVVLQWHKSAIDEKEFHPKNRNHPTTHRA